MNETIINTPTYIRPGIWSKKVEGNPLMVHYFAKVTLSGSSKFKTNVCDPLKSIQQLRSKNYGKFLIFAFLSRKFP